MRTLRLTLAYDGTRYLGWQRQPYGPTIQGELEDALKKLTGETIDVAGSGRTDAGVHALGQVASFATASAIPLNRFAPGLTHYLPRDIVVRAVEEVAEGFHAQFHAKKKRYRYLLADRPPLLPFLRPYVWVVRGRLDAAAMHEAGQALIGTHDFRCFETKYPNKATSVRTLLELSVRRLAAWAPWDLGPDAASARASDDSTAPFLALDVVADGFLWNMVRAITGTLVNVGLGKWTIDDVRRILATGSRSLAGETAPAQGLFLVSVDYAAP